MKDATSAHQSSSATTSRTEVLAPEASEALAGLLGIDPPTDVLPELWHWVHLMERRPQADLGLDGHPLVGIPTPPQEGFRRMFAGGRVEHRRSLRLGEVATRRTEVVNTRVKQGRTGPLTFVCVRHLITQAGDVAVVEEQDIVYLPLAKEGAAPRAAEAAQTPGGAETLELAVDERVLFRFSALTYNAHRIHYDRQWAAHEGYHDLVVHGPLQALMMGELQRRKGAGLHGRVFAYRLVAPMIGSQVLRAVAEAGGLNDGAVILDVGDRVTARSSFSPQGTLDG